MIRNWPDTTKCPQCKAIIAQEGLYPYVTGHKQVWRPLFYCSHCRMNYIMEADYAMVWSFPHQPTMREKVYRYMRQGKLFDV